MKLKIGKLYRYHNIVVGPIDEIVLLLNHEKRIVRVTWPETDKLDRITMLLPDGTICARNHEPNRLRRAITIIPV